MEHNIQSYPTSILYEDGKVFETLRGIKNMTTMTGTVENALAKTHPGRPELTVLPNPGDTVYPPPEADKQATESVAEKKETGAQGDAKAPVEKPAGDAEKPLDTAPEPAGKNAGKSLDDVTQMPKEAGKSDKTDSTEKPTEESVAAKAGSQNSFGADWKVPSTGQMLKKPKPKDDTPKYNLEGISAPLTPDNFDTLVTNSKDPWFIKFYAPWCSHCKAMAPTWQQLAKNMQGKLNIGEVNCEADHKLCTQMGVKAFPTILFMTGAEKSEYKGLRGVGDFVAYAEGALEVAGGVSEVDAESFKELEKTEEVLFVYFYDHATTTEDFKALDALPLNLIGRGKIVKTNDPALCSRFKITTWPRLLVSREGRATYYTPITPDEMRDVDSLVSWMKSTWLPLVPQLTAVNAKQIMSHKLVVLAILKQDDEDRLQNSISELKNAANEWVDRQVQEFQLERKRLRDAKQMRIEEAQSRDDQRGLRNAKAIKIDMDSTRRKEVGFAWVDGIFWQRWIASTYNIDVRDGERVIINEEDVRLPGFSSF
jgi:protein disulfide-isomerase